MPLPLIILGASGSVHDVLDVVVAINRVTPTWNVLGVLDDNRQVGSKHLGLPVLGAIWAASQFAHASFINAIGSDTSYSCRPVILESTGLNIGKFATLVHPQASVSSRARLGRGVLINYNASIGGGVFVGNHASIGPGSIVGHDTTIGDFAILAPGAIVSGSVRIGRNAYIGAASSIRQNIRIGERALVGMGAVVVKDVLPGRTVVGNPAQVLLR